MTEKAPCIDPERGTLLAAYELDLLSPEEQASFEQHLSDCTACRESLYEMAPAIQAIRTSPGQVAERLIPEAPARRMALWRVLVPVAAAAAVVAFVLRPSGGPALPELARIEPVPYVAMETRASGLEEAEQLFRVGMERYGEEQYGRAAPLLAEAYRMMRPSPAAIPVARTAFYAGLSFLLARQPDSAQVYLAEASRVSLPVLVDRSHWYQAQACLLQNRPDCAIEHLEILAGQSPGYGEEAAEQLIEVRQAASP